MGKSTVSFLLTHGVDIVRAAIKDWCRDIWISL